MSTEISLTAKKGLGDKINKAWCEQFPDCLFLIYTPSVIMDEIEYINNDPQQSHLRYIKTVEDWNKTFSILKEGRGSIGINKEAIDDEDDPYMENLIKQMQWLSAHQKMFKKIEGIDDVVELLTYSDHTLELMEKTKLCGFTPLMKALLRGTEAPIKDLLSKPIDIDARNDFGDTALMIQSRSRHIQRLQWLLEAGADPLLKNNQKETALDIAKDYEITITIGFLESAIEARHMNAVIVPGNDNDDGFLNLRL